MRRFGESLRGKRDDEIHEKSTILSVSNNTLHGMLERVSNVVWGIGQIELEFKQEFQLIIQEF